MVSSFQICLKIVTNNSGTTRIYFDIYSFVLPWNVLAVAGLLGIYNIFRLCNCWNSW